MHSIIEIQYLWSLGKAKSLARQRDPSKTSTVEELTRAPTLEYVICTAHEKPRLLRATYDVLS